MYNYLSGLIFYSIFGMLMGVIEAWKRKLFFIMWIIAVILVVISGFVYGVENLASDLVWYQWLYQLIWFILGMLAGRISYNEVFN